MLQTFSANGALHFFIEWCKHADQHFISQAQFAEMLKLIKEIHSQLVAMEEVLCCQTMAFFTNKVCKIYFDHAVWENSEWGWLEIEGLAKLKNLHASARISKEAMMWIAGSLTAVVLPLLVLLLIFFTTNQEHMLQLMTLRGALCKKLTQLILHNFEQHSPCLSIANYKAQLLEGTSLLSLFFFLFLFSFTSYNSDKDQHKELMHKGIHSIKEFFNNNDNQPATVTETHSTCSFKFWYNWIHNGCKPGAHSQDACMFQSIERKVRH
jgi:hypothetical protein